MLNVEKIENTVRQYAECVEFDSNIVSADLVSDTLCYILVAPSLEIDDNDVENQIDVYFDMFVDILRSRNIQVM